MHSSTTRLIAAACTAALSLAAIGLAWESARFGWSDAAASGRLEHEVRQTFAAKAQRVQLLAERVSREGPLVAAAVSTTDGVATLFARLMDLASATETDTISATVYVPAGPPGEFKVLAWSSGPAEDLTADRLGGVPALFVAPGTLGLRLVFVHPIEVGGRRLGVAAAETVLSPIMRVTSAAGTYHLETSFGPVNVTQAFPGAGDGARRPNTFLIDGSGDTPLLEVAFSSEMLAADRAMFRRRTLVAAALPLVLLALVLTGPLLDRRGTSRTIAGFVGWSMAAGGVVAAALLVLIGLAILVEAPAVLTDALAGLAALALVAVFFVVVVAAAAEVAAR